MPTSVEHIKQTSHNQSFLDTFTTPTGESFYPDWSITVIFYIAVHCIEYYFAKMQNVHCLSHMDRNKRIGRDKNLQQIYGDYLRLYNWSKDARYDLVQFTQIEIEEALKRLEKVRRITTSVP